MPEEDYPESVSAVEPTIYDPFPPVAVAPYADTVSGAPPATSADIGGQIEPDTFLGIRTIGPFAGMLLANNPGDPGIEEGVEAGLIIPAVPYEEEPEPPAPPMLTSMTPDSAVFTVTELTIDIHGTGFVEGDRVFADDLEADPVTFINDTQLTAEFLSISVSSPRAVDIKVVNAGGVESNVLPFTYTDTVAGALSSRTYTRGV